MLGSPVLQHTASPHVALEGIVPAADFGQIPMDPNDPNGSNADPMDPTLMCLQQCLLGIRAKEGSNQEREDSQGAYLARCK